MVQHPKKTYLTRLTTSGGTFDFAAVARQDGPGAVVAYVRKETAEFSEDDISLDTMFLGDNYNLDGVVVVSDGTAILASNKSALQGTYSAEFLDRFHQQLAPDRPIRARTGTAPAPAAETIGCTPSSPPPLSSPPAPAPWGTRWRPISCC